ncbi:MAG TPA: hypothetical protein VKZ57_08905 [Sphingobacterium sp.]|jgi:hypothetical protein|nr:hypothetical protein [Sphingobacterium sp.]
MIVTKNFLYLSLSILFIVVACSKDNKEDDNLGPVTTEPFTEGTVEMGMYSHGIDLGYYIKNIDFSRNDTREQLENLMKERGSEQDFISHFQAIGEQNPFAALVLVINTSICDYYIKGETVLGKAQGFGYIYDHFHDQGNDVGKIYMETDAQVAEIPESDRKLYVEYAPSAQKETNPNSSFDADLFDRKPLSKKENILGYACDVTEYTPKVGSTSPSGVIMHKILVYTSPLFSNTINFTHPFYVPEAGGILRVDIFLEDNEQPTLEMRPYKITPQPISETELVIQHTEPIYALDDFNWGMKSLAIFMSGWSTFED